MSRTFTNRHNLPETIVKAVQYDTHRLAGTISVTTLIDSAQIRVLKKLHNYTEDVADAVYALLGTAVHHVLERANIDSVRKRAFILTAETIISEADKMTATAPEKAEQLKKAANYIFQLIPVFFPEMEEKYIFERTLRLEIGTETISGTFDLYDKTTGILYDYKLCSVFSFIHPESREKWRYQTNVYAYMLQQEGLPVNAIKVVAIFRDWSASGLLRDKEYPARQVMEIDVPLGNPNRTDVHWTDLVRQYIDRRIAIHQLADQGTITECTGEERWATADTYAVKTPKNKRAVRVFDSQAAALAYIEENRGKYATMSVEKRPGESKRCEKFCPVAEFCSQRKRELEIKALEQ